MSNIRNRFCFTALFSFVAILSIAQQKNNSPYSRLGMGNLVNQNFASLNGMSNLAASFQSSTHANLLNPASLPYLTATAFEMGMRVNYANLQSENEETGVWSGSLGYISLAFPMFNPISEALTRKESNVDWGMSFALVPYSIVGYDIETTTMLPDIGQIFTRFSGSGTTYRFMWGNGIRYKKLSVGVNVGYIFGKQSREQTVDFDSLQSHYHDKFHDDFSLNGFVWNAGVQYRFLLNKKNSQEEKIKSGEQIVLGIYGNSNMNIQSKFSQLYYRANLFYNDVDTIRHVPVTTLRATLPMELGGGVMYQKPNKFRLGINYSTALWSNYENETKPESLKNAYQVSAGGEIIPEYDSYNNYFKKMRYRFGAFYKTDPRSDGFNEQLTGYGITLGAGFPIILPRQTTSFVDIAFELGRFGSDQALMENYINMTIGFTFNDDKWFIKRKFN